MIAALKDLSDGNLANVGENLTIGGGSPGDRNEIREGSRVISIRLHVWPACWRRP
ncbi:hypothetical protein ACTMU2_37710 [Cupriavidus basilensis]